jgi:hypothetical protein
MYTESARLSLLGGCGGGAELRIRIYWIRIQHFKWILFRIRIQGFDDKKLEKYSRKMFFFISKIEIYLSLGLLTGRPSRSFLPSWIHSSPDPQHWGGGGGREGWHILPTTGGHNSTISQGDDRDRDHVLKNSFSQFCKIWGEGKELL